MEAPASLYMCLALLYCEGALQCWREHRLHEAMRHLVIATLYALFAAIILGSFGVFGGRLVA